MYICTNFEVLFTYVCSYYYIFFHNITKFHGFNDTRWGGVNTSYSYQYCGKIQTHVPVFWQNTDTRVSISQNTATSVCILPLKFNTWGFCEKDSVISLLRGKWEGLQCLQPLMQSLLFTWVKQRRPGSALGWGTVWRCPFKRFFFLFFYWTLKNHYFSLFLV